jgi:hypothetical protein
MPERRRDRLHRIVLPRLRLEGDDTLALPDDRDICETVEGASRTQIVDGQADRLWRRCDAEFARHTDNRCSLQGPSRLVDGSFDGTAGIETLRAAIVDLITRSLPLTLGDMHLANTQQSQ